MVASRATIIVLVSPSAHSPNTSIVYVQGYIFSNNSNTREARYQLPRRMMVVVVVVVLDDGGDDDDGLKGFW